MSQSFDRAQYLAEKTGNATPFSLKEMPSVLFLSLNKMTKRSNMAFPGIKEHQRLTSASQNSRINKICFLHF